MPDLAIPLSLTLCFKLGAPVGLLGILFLWARKCCALKFNCATVQQQQQVNVKTKQTDGINDDDDQNKEKEQEKDQAQEEKGRGNSALVPGQKIY